jgi:hypothetical protein
MVKQESYADIKQCLLQIQTYADTVLLLDTIAKRMLNDNSQELRSIRQKVYDIRRRLNLKPDQVVADTSNQTEQTKVIPPQMVQTSNIRLSYADMLSIGSFSVFDLASASMIYIQSLEIYTRANFDNPVLATCGALLVVCAASVLRAIKPNRVTMLLCLYVLCFEGYLLVSGTQKAEISQATQTAEISERVQALQLKSEQVKESVDKMMELYEEKPSSWVKTKLDKAKSVYVDSLNAVAEAKKPVVTNDFSLLKIMYRLSLLFLFTLSVSYLVTSIRSKL